MACANREKVIEELVNKIIGCFHNAGPIMKDLNRQEKINILKQIYGRCMCEDFPDGTSFDCNVFNKLDDALIQMYISGVNIEMAYDMRSYESIKEKLINSSIGIIASESLNNPNISSSLVSGTVPFQITVGEFNVTDIKEIDGKVYLIGNLEWDNLDFAKKHGNYKSLTVGATSISGLRGNYPIVVNIIYIVANKGE